MSDEQRQERCDGCDFWGALGDGRGYCEATTEQQREPLVRIEVYKLDSTGTAARIFVPMSAEERQLVSAALVTPADFFCASWQARRQE